jgi:hypothetical protein
VKLISDLNAMAVNAGGRIYPAKDSLMSADQFSRGFPEAERARAQFDSKLSSAFARRVGLVPAQAEVHL